MPPKKKAKKKGTTMSQNVKQSVVVHVNTTKRRQPTRGGNRSQPMSKIQTPQFVGVVGQDYSTYNNQLNNITQAIANAIKQPDRTGNLITTPPRQAPDQPIHNIPSVVNMETQTAPSIANTETQTIPSMDTIRQARLTRIQTPTPNSPLSSNTPSEPPPPLSDTAIYKRYIDKYNREQRDFLQKAIYDTAGGGGLPVAESRFVRGRTRTKSQPPPSAGIAIASTSQMDRQTRITDFKPINQGQEGGREGARPIKRTLLPRGQPAEEQPATTPKKGRRPDSPFTKRSKELSRNAISQAIKELERGSNQPRNSKK